MNSAVLSSPVVRSTNRRLRRGQRLRAVAAPRGRLEGQFIIPDSSRDRGIHVVAGSGSGKSLWMGLLSTLDLLRGVPQVVFDPAGQMIDAILLNIAQLTKRQRRSIWPRVRYLDMSGRRDPIPQWPLLFQLPGDSPVDVADRFLQTCRAIDPQLETASIQGFNALYRIGAPTGVILAHLGLQLDAADALISEPAEWTDVLSQAADAHPDAAAAAAFFRDRWQRLTSSQRHEQSMAYRAKLEPLLLDSSTRQMFCTAPASVDMRRVEAARELVLLDFRRESNPRKRLLKTRWAYDSILAYVRHRGPGRHLPIALHFDEITELTNQSNAGNDVFARDLDYLFNVLQRNYACWITAAHQQMWQLSETTQETLLSLGTQVFGVISDHDTAESLARRYAPLDPRRVKRTENVWMNDRDFGPYVIEKKPVDFPMHEQAFVAARTFMGLRPFEFLVKPRTQTGLNKVNVQEYVGRPWPNEHARLLRRIRRRLSAAEVRRLGVAAAESGEGSDTLESNDTTTANYRAWTHPTEYWNTAGDETDALE